MRWRQLDTIERVALVIYGVGILVFVVVVSFALIAGERSTWTVYAVLLWQIAYTAFGPVYRRCKARNEAGKSADGSQTTDVG